MPEKKTDQPVDTPEVKYTNQPPHQDGPREIIETIAVALILAFLFRAFVAEAYVIPTGSMAYTLMGRHKDTTCDQCGYQYRVGASDELTSSGYLIQRIEHSICPSCRYRQNIKEDHPFAGDRIIVNKFSFEIQDPQRWDVIVFKCPEEPKTNYIKRAVGLPGESIKIERGNVFARTDDTGEWKILRKENPYKQLLLKMPVYENDYAVKALQDRDWPERWSAVKKSEDQSGLAGWIDDAEGWKSDIKKRTFSLASSDQVKWLRYQNIVPSQRVWNAIEDETKTLPLPKPELISDFCGYNAASTHLTSYDTGIFWVSDLTVDFQLDVSEINESSQAIIDLNAGVRKYQCEINLKTGEATVFLIDKMLADDEKRELGKGSTTISGAGTYQITFANVDQRLCLWVNGKLINLGQDVNYHAPSLVQAQDSDLIPVGIAAKNVEAKIAHLSLYRDIYYRSERLEKGTSNNFSYRERHYPESNNPGELKSLLIDPANWSKKYEESSNGPAIFEKLNDDEFFVMGDNSPRSQDSRLWGNNRGAERRHAVPRDALIGKAFYVYWPHGVPFMNDGKGYSFWNHKVAPNKSADPPYPNYSAPFYPQIKRMRRIR